MKDNSFLMKHNICTQFLLQIILLGFVLSFSVFAEAQEVIDLQVVGKVKISEKPATRDDLMQAAVEAASLDNIRLLIGAAKTDRNMKVIREKIIPNSNRYILSLQTGAITKKGTETVLPVEMKLSLKNLRAILLEEGLLYQIEGAPKVLPLVTFDDRVGSRQYAWWTPSRASENDLASLSLRLESLLKARLAKVNFLGITPQASKLAANVPQQFRNSNLQRGDAQVLGENLKNQVVIRGDVTGRAKPNSDTLYLIDFKLEALHSSNGRVIGEVVRTFETDAGGFRSVFARKYNEVVEKTVDELVTQIEEVWKSGSFGSTLLRLTVIGDLKPKEIEQLKRAIPLQVRDIKNVRERRIEARVTTFEIDATGVPQQLAQAIKAAKWAPFKVAVKEVLADGLVLEATQ